MVKQPEPSVRWIFIRGLTRCAAHWGAFLPLMKEKFPLDQVLSVELPGVGSFHDKTSPKKVEEITHFLRGQLTPSDKSQKTVLVALSFGALTALQWMREFPQELSGAVWINTSFSGVSPSHDRLNWQNARSLLKIVATKDPKVKEKIIFRLSTSIKSYDDALVTEWAKLATTNPVSRKTLFSQLIAAMRYRAPKDLPNVPTWILCGMKDRLVNPQCSIAIHRKYPKTRLLSHPDGGHDLPLDAPEWTLTQLRDIRSQLFD